MVFTVELASDWECREIVEINSLDDMKAIQDKYNHNLIVNFVRQTIIVYDDYVE